MKKLPDSYRKNGSDFNLIERHGDIAIYSQSDNGIVYAYEVFIVQQHPERRIKDRIIEAKESTPPDEAWGIKGYTSHTIPEAQERGRQLRAGLEKRNKTIRHSSPGILEIGELGQLTLW